jgi:hypothetical protein
VRVEGVGDVQVVGDEAAEPLLALVDGRGVGCAAEGDVCAAVGWVLVCRESGGWGCGYGCGCG